MEFISLSQLLRGSRVYERLPQPLQDALKRSVWYTLITEIAALSLFIFLPNHIWWTHVQPGGFFLGPSVDITNAMLDIAVVVLPYLMVINLFNLFLTLSILTVSLLLMGPVHEPFHWLATANALPAGLNIVLTTITVGFLAIIVIINAIIWVIIITVAISLIFGALMALFSSSR